MDTQELHCNIGMIFQEPAPFPLTIRRNIELPLREHGMSKQADLNNVVQQVLQDVGLCDEVKDRLKSTALALSGGQQQRLCIARALHGHLDSAFVGLNWEQAFTSGASF
jgi:phosphate transport system ATP-binding protein